MMIIMSKKAVMHVNAEKKETTERMICANLNTMLNVQSWFCYARALASQILMYTSSFSTLSIQTDFESDESLNLNQSKFIDLHFISICAFRMNPILLFFELFFVFVIQDFCLSCIGFITMRMQQRRETIPFYINQLYRGKKKYYRETPKRITHAEMKSLCAVQGIKFMLYMWAMRRGSPTAETMHTMIYSTSFIWFKLDLNNMKNDYFMINKNHSKHDHFDGG